MKWIKKQILRLRLWIAGRLIGESRCVAYSEAMGAIYIAGRSMELLASKSGHLRNHYKAAKKVRNAGQDVQALVARATVRTRGWRKAAKVVK